MVKLALMYEANIDLQNNAGNTALHFCYMYGFGESLGSYLLEKGANDKIKNHKGSTCYAVKMKGGHEFDDSPVKVSNNNLYTTFEESEGDCGDEYAESKGGGESFNQGWAEEAAAAAAAAAVEKAQEVGQEEGQNWDSDYVENYGYESNEASFFGAASDDDDEGFFFEEAGAGGDAKKDYYQEDGGAGGDHYTSEDGLQCFVDDGGGRFYWDENDEIWVPFIAKAEAKQEAKQEAKEEAKIEEVQVKPLSVPKIKTSTTKRPPPSSPSKPKHRPRPPPQQLRPPPIDVDVKAKPRRPPPKDPHPKKNQALPTTTTTTTTTPKQQQQQQQQQNPQLMLMEAIAANSTRKIKKILTLPNISQSDIHAAMLNSVAKGRLKIVNCLLDKANSQSCNHGLLIAAKMANVELIRILLPSVSREGKARALLAATKTGVNSILSLFFEEGGGSEENDSAESKQEFLKPEVQRMILSCAGKNQLSALEAILPQFQANSGEIAGGRTGNLTNICKQALTVACAKGHVEVSKFLLSYTNVNFLDSTLSLCAAKGELEVSERNERALMKTRNIYERLLTTKLFQTFLFAPSSLGADIEISRFSYDNHFGPR